MRRDHALPSSIRRGTLWACLGLLVGSLLVLATASVAIHETPKLPNPAEDGDTYFGRASAIDGDTAVVGATGPDEGGTAYVFESTSDGWALATKLEPWDVQDSGEYATLDFGGAVALEGDTAVVGASLEGENRGAAYVYTNADGEWTRDQKIVPEDAQNEEAFGSEITLGGDRLFISAHAESGEDCENGYCDPYARGAVYVFERSNGAWRETQKLHARDASEQSAFGLATAVESNWLVVGAPHEDTGGYQSGAVYVFESDGDTWEQTAKLQPPSVNESDRLGADVAISGDRILAGAWGFQDEQGAGFLFSHGSDEWTQAARWTPESPADSTGGAGFGISLGLDGDTAYVGAPYEQDQQGAVYTFSKETDGWKRAQAVTGHNDTPVRKVGINLALGDDLILVSAAQPTGSNTERGQLYALPQDPGRETASSDPPETAADEQTEDAPGRDDPSTANESPDTTSEEANPSPSASTATFLVALACLAAAERWKR